MLLLPALVAEERERIPVLGDQLMRFLFKLAGGTTRHDHFRKDAQMPRQALSAFAKRCDLFLGGRYHTHPVQKIRLRIFLKSEYRKNAFVNGCNVGFAVYFADGPSAFPKPCYRKHHVLFVPRKTAVQSLVGRVVSPSARDETFLGRLFRKREDNGLEIRALPEVHHIVHGIRLIGSAARAVEN